MSGLDDSVRFGVLGPLWVHTGGRELPAPANRERILLAMLLLRAGEPVPVQRLVEAVWGDSPPRTAHNGVQACISRLRGLLTGAGLPAGIINRVPAGYRVLVDRDQVDLHRFRGLTTQARDAAAAGRQVQARDRYREAAALWRGPALAGVDSELVRRVAATLEEERVLALEERVEVELALGGGGELVSELTDLVNAHPYREDLHGALMRALYRAGRQADALEAFRRAGRVFREDLGIEPGEELHRLHKAILNRDPALELAAAPPLEVGPPSGTAPRELPAEAACFVGRDEEAARVRQCLLPADSARRPAVVVLYGPGGVGKSALAVRVAHELSEAYPDGQLYADLRGSTPGVRPVSAVEVLGRFLRRLGVAPDQIPPDEEGAAALFRSIAAGRRLLFVLDNAATTAQVVGLVPAAPGCGVLVTAREPLSSLDAAARLRVGVLTEAAGVAMLEELTRGRAVEPAAARSVVELSGGLPLAIRVAAGRLASRPDLSAATYVERLASRRLDELELGDLAVRACIRTSYDALLADGADVDRLAARAFRMLGLLRVPNVTSWVVAAMLGEPEPEVARAALDRLVEAQLVEPVVGDRYQLHDLVRLLAAERAEAEDPAPDREHAVARAIAYYTAAVTRANLRTRPGDVVPFRRPAIPDDLPMPIFQTPASASSWLDDELTNLVAGLEQASTTPGFDELLVLQMANRLCPVLYIRAAWETARGVSMAVAKSLRSNGSDEAIASALIQHGAWESRLSNFEEAIGHLDRALTMTRRLSNDAGIVVALKELGTAHTRRGAPAAALPRFEEALALARRLGFRHLEVGALMGMSIAHFNLGNSDDAVAAAAQAANMCVERGDPWSAAACATSLVAAYSLGGDQAEAVRCADEALALARQVRYTLQECMTLLLRAEANLRWGRVSDAYADVECALPLARSSGYHYAWPVAQWQLSKVLEAMGRASDAVVARQRAEDAHARMVGTRRDMHMERVFEWHVQPAGATAGG